MQYSKRALKLAVPFASLALVLSGCGGDGGSTVTPGAQDSVNGISTQFNDADVTFINDMSPHHTGALAMSELAPERADSAEVKQLAEKISAAQGPELERMKDMAEAWDVELETGSEMAGMSMGDDVKALTPLSGPAFDREFLTRMIAHHEGALPMAQSELGAGENPQAKQLAQEILDMQKAEIAEMEQILGSL